MKKWFLGVGISLAILLVCGAIIALVSAAGAPPPPGGGPPPPGSGSGGAVGPVGIDFSWDADESLYPLEVYSGNRLLVMDIGQGRMTIAELEVPYSLYPTWAIDFANASWVVWPMDVFYSGGSDIRVGDIVDMRMIYELGLGFRVTKIRLTQTSSG